MRIQAQTVARFPPIKKFILRLFCYITTIFNGDIKNDIVKGDAVNFPNGNTTAGCSSSIRMQIRNSSNIVIILIASYSEQ